MELKIRKTSEENYQYLKVLTYGYSGTGKTMFAGGAPKPLFLDIEAGLLTLRNKDVDAVKIEKWKDVEDVFMFLKNEKHDYQTVVVDSLTELQKKLADELIKGKERLTIGDWGILIDKIRRFVRHVRDLPMHVIVICLADQRKDDEKGRVYAVPSLNGKALPGELAAYFDIVLYQYTKKNKDNENGAEYLALTHGEERVVAKDRSGKLKPVIVPSFDEIKKEVFEEKEKKNGTDESK